MVSIPHCPVEKLLRNQQNQEMWVRFYKYKNWNIYVRLTTGPVPQNRPIPTPGPIPTTGPIS